eukprot:COSAG04_NODE_9606_length_848_cov_1.004005_2_plen_37_part_01
MSWLLGGSFWARESMAKLKSRPAAEMYQALSEEDKAK